MIIIAQPNFTTQAERLAEAHRTKDNLTVRVVTPESIYNEIFQRYTGCNCLSPFYEDVLRPADFGS